jgi:hypothetical protein
MMSINGERITPFYVGSRCTDVMDARLLAWSFGFCGQRNVSAFSSILYLFRKKTLRKGQIVVKSGNMSKYVWLVASGSCFSTLMHRICQFSPGSWIGLESGMRGDPVKVTVKVESAVADFMRIGLFDFVYRLPPELISNLRRRVYAISKIPHISFNKEFKIDKSVLDEVRNPSPRTIPSARLLSVREINDNID